MTTTSVRPRRPLIALVTAVAVALPLAACGGPTVVGAPEDRTDVYPAVADNQARSILGAVDAVLARGVPANAAIDARVLGPYKDIARTQARADALLKVRPATTPALEPRQLLVPQAGTWPRFFVAVGNTANAPTPQLRVLTAPGPRTPYGVWAQLSLLPGVTLPELDQDANGTPVVPPDAKGLVATPAQALDRFADYLTLGTTAPNARSVRRSAYMDQIIQRAAADKKALAPVAVVASRHTVEPGMPFALRTADGGALVIGALRQRYTITVKKGKGSVELRDKDLAAIVGKKRFTKSLTRLSLEVVALKVPPAGEGLISVVAAQKGDVGVTAS